MNHEISARDTASITEQENSLSKMDRPTLQEQLDACRNAEQAANDPLLRELAEALKVDPQVKQQFENHLASDAQSQRALESIAVPPDLQEKLLTAFRQGAKQQELDRARNREMVSQAVAASTDVPADDAVVSKSKPVLATRRRFPKKSLAALATVAAVILVLFAFRGGSSERLVDLTSSDFAREALRIRDEKDADWHEFDMGPASPVNWNPGALPLVKSLQPVRWRKVDRPLLRDGVLWELSSTAGERIYVLASNAPWKAGLLPDVLSQAPTIPSSGNWTVGVFRKGDVSYALIVEGNADRFRSLIRSSDIAANRVQPLKCVAGKAA